MAACPQKLPATDWSACDTLLLDMDGTVLDLSFDNYFWRELVPRCLSRERGRPHAQVREELFALYAGKQGTLDWYCLDYWTSALGLDLKALKEAASHRIRFLPGAREFLQAVAGSDKRVVLVTNAHGVTLEIKRGVAGLDRFFDTCVTSHDFGHAKEHAAFWPLLRERLDFDPAKTVFVDDSLPVLATASGFGIRHVIAVRRPDTRQPAAAVSEHAAVDGIRELLKPPPLR
ncbi:MAG: GMP/IMP nucleotidase [Chromatiales bacterium]|nr:MAG: GMP/IMP nucleotidase [Chromatiales bacterium]